MQRLMRQLVLGRIFTMDYIGLVIFYTISVIIMFISKDYKWRNNFYFLSNYITDNVQAIDMILENG